MTTEGLEQPTKRQDSVEPDVVAEPGGNLGDDRIASYDARRLVLPPEPVCSSA